MYELKKFEFAASDISVFVDSSFLGEDIVVNKIRGIDNLEDNCVSLCLYSEKSKLDSVKNTCLIFCNKETIVENKNISYIVSDNPKYIFFRFIKDFCTQFTTYAIKESISIKTESYPDVIFGYNVKVGHNTIIAPQTKIGTNCLIGNNVVIRSNVEIGDNCIIKDNCVIGSEAFDFIRHEDNIINIPNIGNIKIGNDVIIGANCTIEKPIIGETLIRDGAKIDDLVNIGQNTHLGQNSIVTSGYVGERGVFIGNNTFIGIGVIITRKICIGNDCVIGAGSVLSADVPDKTLIHSIYNNREEKRNTGKNLIF